MNSGIFLFLILLIYGCFQKRGKTPKMDGENKGKPYEQMDDLGVALFLETPIYLHMHVISLCVTRFNLYGMFFIFH